MLSFLIGILLHTYKLRTICHTDCHSEIPAMRTLFLIMTRHQCGGFMERRTKLPHIMTLSIEESIRGGYLIVVTRGCETHASYHLDLCEDEGSSVFLGNASFTKIVVCWESV